MTRDDIIRMAREADPGFDGGEECDGTMTDSIVGINQVLMFAAIVAAAEREACAKVCDAEGDEWDSDEVVTEKNYAAHCAHRIRARGNA